MERHVEGVEKWSVRWSDWSRVSIKTSNCRKISRGSGELLQMKQGLISWDRLSLVVVAWGGLIALSFGTPQAAAQQAVQFSNVTRSAGIHFTHFKGNEGIAINLEEFGPGVCVADFDGDGWQDIYFVNGRDLYGRGIKVQNALYHNNGDGTFTDVTNKAGVAGMDFGTYFQSGATFLDYDRDGKLDLYVGGYVAFAPGARRYCDLGGVTSSCPPSAYQGSANILYHNNGDGTFTNVTKKAGIYQPNGKNLSVGAADYDNDGWPDLFVANDGLNAYLYHNERNGTFKEEGGLSGMAFTNQGHTMAAMCISLGDYNNDGWLDLYISDFQGSSDHLWKNDGQGSFDEVSDHAGITQPTRAVLSFGGGFFDYDNDGWLDLFIANGHVYPEVEQATPGTQYKQINTLFHNDGHGKFIDVTKTSGDGFSTPYVGRGVAFVDFDNDGFQDVVVGNNGDPPLLLHNSGGNGRHFVSFKLEGTKSNRDAMGARRKLTAGGVTQIREIAGGGSYLSQSDLRAHFGLGSAEKIDKLEITWPNGAQQTFKDFTADQFYSIREGKNELGYQPFVKAKR